LAPTRGGHLGVTLIQRSEGTPPPSDPRIALVLAGGAITGGAFKVGGLKALDACLVGRSVTQFDSYVGVSAGSFLAVALAGGIGPEEIIGAMDGTSRGLDPLRPFDFYRPNLGEAVSRSFRFSLDAAAWLPRLLLDLLVALPELPRTLRPLVLDAVRRPGWARVEALLDELRLQVAPRTPPPSIGALLPSGLFDNASLGRWLARQLERRGLPDDFAAFRRATGRTLYITAAELDTAQPVVFGPDDSRGLRISEAVQASSALPGFMRPARFNGVDYIDGGVRRTADVDVAVSDGADLIICYNPFRPFLNDRRDGALADRGLPAVLAQTFRAILHSRLDLNVSACLTDENFRGDLVLIQARETDAQFFDLNPLMFWKREDAIRHGLISVRTSLADAAEELRPLLARHGLEFRAPEKAPDPAEPPGDHPNTH
jgi:predicted acylesterase/phospholipase RssA